MDLRGIRIGTRLAVGFGIILLLLMTVLIADALISNRNRHAMITGPEAANTKSALAEAIKSSVLEGGIAMRNIGLQTELDAMKKEADKVNGLRRQFHEARSKLAQMGLDDDEKKILAGTRDWKQVPMFRSRKPSALLAPSTARMPSS